MTEKNKTWISLLCPFYNEEKTIPVFFETFVPILEKLAGERKYEILCVNDGSSDDTLLLLNKYAENNSNIRIINLSRNFGKEAALSAAIDFSEGELVIPVDADLQDPPELVNLLVAKQSEGYDVVLARRSNRKSDSFFKRTTASCFYKLHNRISTLKLPENVGDCRIMTREVVEAIKLLPERHRFMKGLFAWVGFKTAVIDYTRRPRSAGKTKFNTWKLWNFALEGVTSFSTIPLSIWLYCGFITAFGAFAYAVFIILRVLLCGKDMPGYASLVCLILFLGGIQLIGIGIVGEYLGRTYIEIKQRPVYITKKEGTKLNDSGSK